MPYFVGCVLARTALRANVAVVRANFFRGERLLNDYSEPLTSIMSFLASAAKQLYSH